MASVDEFIQKHRTNGLLVDTNLLVLFFVGRVNRERIRSHKRTEKYVVEDFDTLESFMAEFSKWITTPHVLAEVSNLARFQGKEAQAFCEWFKRTVELMKEYCEPSRGVVKDASFDRLGLTDAAIAALSRHRFLVLTDDLDLHLTLLRRGVDSVNFNQIRPYYWNS